MLIHVWRHDVKPESVADFMAYNRPEGQWDEFFSHARGYHCTTLLRNESGLVQLTADNWSSEAMFRAYTEDVHQCDEFKVLSERNESLTSNQEELGWFQLVRSYRFGDARGILGQLMILHPKKDKDAALEALVAPQGPIFELLRAGSPRFKGSTVYFGANGLLLEQHWALEGLDGKSTYELPQVTEVARREIRGLCRSKNPIEDFGTFTKVSGNEDSPGND